MELRQCLAAARRWWWLLVLCPAMAAAAAFATSRSSVVQPYQATATVMVSSARSGVTTSFDDQLTSQELSRTYSQLIPSSRIRDLVVARLGLASAADLGQVDARVSGGPAHAGANQRGAGSQFLDITVTHPDAEQAARVANATATVFAEYILERQTQQRDLVLDDVNQQLAEVQEQLRAANSTLLRLTQQGSDRSDEQRSLQLVQTQTELDWLRATLMDLQRQRSTLMLGVAQGLTQIELIEPAAVPSAPIPTPRDLSVLVGALLGLIVGGGIVLLLEYLDDTVKTPESVAAVGGAATLGPVHRLSRAERFDLSRAVDPVRVVPESVAEAFRVIRTNLDFAWGDAPHRTLLVTSARAGEGKTTTAALLALALAQTGQQVVLVDADMRRPTLHTLFGLSNEHGLSRLLSQPALLPEQPGTRVAFPMTRTAVPNLSVVPSGPAPSNPAELLTSPRLATLIDLLGTAADIVIFDSPPLVGIADGAILAARLDGTVLVTDTTRTRAGMLNHAVGILDRAQATVWGVTLNKLSRRGSDGYYSNYYANYRAGYGARPNPDDRSEAGQPGRFGDHHRN